MLHSKNLERNKLDFFGPLVCAIIRISKNVIRWGNLPDFFMKTKCSGGRNLNDDNLIPLDRRTKEERREIARKGGIASGESRRAYKSLKQAAKVFFRENENAAMAVVQAMYEEALGGNVKAVEKLQDLIGETVQREELQLKKKMLQAQNKTDNGKAEALIAGLQEGLSDDLYTETTAADADVAAEEAVPSELT
jgi:general stress protein YciG